MPTVITFHVLIQFAWMEFRVECPCCVFFGRVIELFEVAVSSNVVLIKTINLLEQTLMGISMFCGSSFACFISR